MVESNVDKRRWRVHCYADVCIHSSSGVNLVHRTFGGARKKILPPPLPQIQEFGGGRRETHCFLELNN